MASTGNVRTSIRAYFVGVAEHRYLVLPGWLGSGELNRLRTPGN